MLYEYDGFHKCLWSVRIEGHPIIELQHTQAAHSAPYQWYWRDTEVVAAMEHGPHETREGAKDEAALFLARGWDTNAPAPEG